MTSSDLWLPGTPEPDAELTDDEVMALIHDLPWYAEHAPMKVKDKRSTEKVPMRFRPAQRYVWAKLWALSNSGRLVRAVIPKARQLGMTTMFLGHKVHICQVREGRECYVLLHDLKPARKAWQRMKDMHASIDGDNVTKAKLEGELKGRLLEFDTESNIMVESVGKEGVGRSETLHHVHATELPSWDDPETTMDGIEESVPDLPGFETSIVLESTSEGVGDWWYWKIQEAKRGKGGYALIFLPWYLEVAYGALHPFPWELDERKLRRRGLASWTRGCGVPLAEVLLEELSPEEVMIAKRIRQEAPSFGIRWLDDDFIVAKLLWRRSKQERRGGEKFKQEYPLTVDESFLGTGRPVFRAETVQFHKLRTRDDGTDLVTPAPQRLEVVHTETTFEGNRENQIWTPRGASDGALHVWKGFEEGARYLVAGDPSMAVKDPSAIQVCRVEPDTLEQVAVWHDHIGATELAWITVWLALAYGNAGIIPESSGEAGGTYVGQLAKIRWPGRRLYRRQVIGPDGRTLINRWGWDTNGATRGAVIETIYDLLATQIPVFRHEATLMEMEQFRLDKKGRPDHPSGGHSDLLMAWGILAHNRHQFAAPVHRPRTKRGGTYEASKDARVRTRRHDGGRQHRR